MSDEMDMMHGQEKEVESALVQIAPVPRISLQAFCESSSVAETIDDASIDRRMAKAHVKVHMGGVHAAVEAFSTAPTPNLIVIEAGSDQRELLDQLDSLAEY